MDLKREYTAIAADVKRAQEGDRAAMDRIIGDVQDPVYYTCLSILHNREAAQDVAQDVLCTVFTKLNKLQDPSSYIGWVNRITANRCKNRLSRSGREVFLQEDEDGNDPFAFFEQTDEQTVPELVLDNAETQRMILELVNGLPDEQRMCVMLFYYDRMKTREIADALSVSEGTVKSRLNYARKAIKEGVLRYEKQGVKLYGMSPIALLSYFLGKAAKANLSPVGAQAVRAASVAASASGAGAAAAEGVEVVAEGASAAGRVSAGMLIGRVVTGVLAAGLLAGIGIGLYSMVNRSRRHRLIEGPAETPIAEVTVTPEQTPEPTPGATPEPTPELTPEPTPELTPEPPDQTGGPEEIRYTLDDYGAGKSFTPGERMSTAIGEDIVCMWNQCVFNNDQYTGDIVVDGIARDNAMLFYVEYDNKDRKLTDTNKIVMIDGVRYYGDLSGYFTMDVPDDYEQLSFMLGAASEPARFYGPPSTHGKYRLCVYADDELEVDTGWVDNTYVSTEPFTVQVAGCSTVRFELRQTCGVQTVNRNGEATEINYALNPVIFDVVFTKTENGTELSD